MGNPDIAKYGEKTQFTSERQPNNLGNNGRKKNVWKHLRDQYELGTEDVTAIIQNLSRMSKEELTEYAKKPETTMLEHAYISAYMQAVKKGTLNELETMLNRVIGKVKDNVDLSSDGFKIVFENKIKNE